MLQHIPFHVHVSSMDSGSTVETMVDRVIELQKDLPVKYATITDHGFMGDCFKFYDVCRKKKVKPILGVEGYFKDDTCEFLQGQEANLKYNHIILHFIDQEAYQKGCELLSKADARGIVAGGERKPLFNWADLEEFSRYNVTLGTACLLGMATRYLLINRADLAAKYYLKLRDMFKDNFYVELLPHICDKKWENGVRLHFSDNTSLFVRTDSKLDTDYKDEVTAQEAYNYASKVTYVKARYFRKQRIKINKSLVSIERVKDFVLEETGDVQLNANRFCLAMAMKYGDKIVISEDAHYATREDKVVQDMRLGEDFRFYGSYHLMDKTEVYDYFMNVMGLSEEMIDGWVENSYNWAKKFDSFELKYEYSLVKTDRPAIQMIGEWIKDTGRLSLLNNDKRYVEQLKFEIDTFANNGVVDLLPYFIPIKEVLDHYSQNGQVTGPLRGSCGGSTLLYLSGITHVDPIKYNIPFERFFNKKRAQVLDFPDVDIDLNNKDLLFGEDKKSGFLFQRYGDCSAQISTRMLMRLKSSIKDVNRFINKGTVEPDIDKIAEGLPVPPQGVSDQDFVYGYTDSDGNEIEGIIDTSDVLKKYIESRPSEWKIVERALGLARGNSAHASGVAIAGRPIREILPTFSVGSSSNISQYAAKCVEKAKVIKYDFLSISVLQDVTVCLELINKQGKGVFSKAGWFKHDEKDTFIWDLPHSEEAYKDMHEGKVETNFQTSTKAMLPFVLKIKPTSITDLAIILALCRPGPMDFIMDNGRTMADEYIARRQGISKSDIPELDSILPDTYSLMVFQEDLTKVAKQFAGMEPLIAEKLRKVMSKKQKTEVDKIKPLFIEGAKKNGHTEELSVKIWSMMETFARYGFNCLSGDTKIKTKKGLATIKEICYNLKEHEVLFKAKNGDFKFEKPSWGQKQGVKKVITAKLSDGTVLKATEDHRFLSNGKWVPFKEIIEKGLDFDLCDDLLIVDVEKK